MRASCGVRADNGSDRGEVVARLFRSRQQELAWLDHAVRLNLVFSMEQVVGLVWGDSDRQAVLNKVES